MAQFDVTILTRRLYPGPLEDAFSEVFDAEIFAEYGDEDPFLVTIISDSVRENISNDLNLQQDHSGPVAARTVVQAVPAEGLVGNFFQVNMVKQVPTDGYFKYHRLAVQCIPGYLDHEHVAGGGAIRDGGIS